MAEPLLPLAESLSSRERFREDIRRIATYTSQDLGGEGTCGYLLSEEQFRAVFAAGEKYAAALIEAHARTPRSQGGPCATA